MIGLVSNSPSGASFDVIKAVLPISIGIVSAVYLTAKVATNAGYGTDKSVPTASVRPGDSTHDKEYREDQDAFVKRCEEECGPTFNVYLFGKFMTVLSGPQVREVFLNESFSAPDALDEFTNMMSFFDSIKKSNKNDDLRIIHDIVRDNISPNLPLFTPRIVNQLEVNLEREMSNFPEEGGRKLVEKPLKVLQEMVASAMATVFMGSEVAKSRKVIDTFIVATTDFGRVLGNGRRHASTWRSIWARANYAILNPLQVHVQTLAGAATPVILERRRLEAEAIEKGVQWDRPDDIMQRLLDGFDKYGFVDLEDVCAHLLILILVSVHTTSDTSTNLLYYLAAFPQHMDKLYAEQQEVLDAIQQEREKERQELAQKGEPMRDDLDPTHDRDLSAAAIKRMVHMDSFVRETFRFRTERLILAHRARKDITLSSGVKITKGHTVIVNVRSMHQGPEQGDEVDEFRPWRFVGKLKSATKVGTDFLPFGMGKHACPGRFLAIQELKTIGVLMVSKFSKLEIQDPSLTKQALLVNLGAPCITGLTFTSRK